MRTGVLRLRLPLCKVNAFISPQPRKNCLWRHGLRAGRQPEICEAHVMQHLDPFSDDLGTAKAERHDQSKVTPQHAQHSHR